jgi:TP901 family phage tail tape measure protein
MTSPGGDTRQVRVIVSADVANAIRGLRDVSDATDRVGQQAEQTQRKTSTFGDVLKGTLAASGIQAGFSGIVDGFKSVVNGGLAYEQSTNTFRAVTQASNDEMQKMAETAKQLGADVKIPGASAQSAAAAMTELAKGGLTAQQAMEASRGTMILAAAAQIDGAQAAEIQANALNTFGLKADQAGRVANVLANVANQSSGEITDFAQGLAQAGTVASSFGWSIEETTTMLGLMANAGIKGSDAGTSLKTSMTAMLKPTEDQAAALEELGIQTRDANGNMISAEAFTRALAAAKGRMSDAEFNAAAATAFGTDAVRTALVAAQAGTVGYEDMSTALGNVTGAQDVAAANSQGLSGVIDALKNTVDTASLALFEQLQPSIMKVAEAATGLVTPLADALAPALGSVADLASGTLAPALAGLAGFLGAVVEPLSGLIGWFSDLPSPIGTAVLALGGVIALRGPLMGTFTTTQASLSTLLATLRGTAGAAAAGSAGLAGWIASLKAASGAAATFGVVARGALAVLGGPIGLAIIGVTTALSLFSSGSDEAAAATEGLNTAIDEQTGKLKDNAAQIIATEAANSGASAAYERIGGNVADYVDALGGVPGAQEKVNAKIAEARAAYDAAQKSMQEATAGTGNFGAAMGSATNAAGAAVPSIQDLNSATEYLSTAQGALASRTDDVRLANEGLTGELGKGEDQLDQSTEAATPFADALKEMKDAAAEADAQTNFLVTSLQLLQDGSISAEQASRQTAAALREIGGAARDYAEAQQKVADKETELADLSNHLGEEYEGRVITQADLDRASRELADAQDSVAASSDRQFNANQKAAQSIFEMAGQAYQNQVAQGNMMGATSAASAVIAEQRQKFIEAQSAADQESGAAARLADQLGLIPGNVTTIIENRGGVEALATAKQLNAELDRMNNRLIRYTTIQNQTVVVSQQRATLDGLAVHAEGGYISGPGGPTDDVIPAMLSNGEYVVNAKATDRWRGLLEQINAGRFARGGFVRLAAGGAADGSKAAPASSDGASESVSATVTAPDPSLFEDSWDAIVKSTQAAWDGGINPVLTQLSKANTQTGTEVTNLDQQVVAPAWANISTNVQDAANATILPTYTALNAGTEQGGIWQNWLRDTWTAAWRQNQDSTAASVGWTTGITFPQLNTGAQDVGNQQMNLAGTTTEAWTQIGNIIQITYDTKIVPAWTGVKNFTSEMGGFFTGIKDGINAATVTAIGDIGKIKAAIQDFFSLVNAQVASAGFKDGGVIEGFATGGEITQGTGPRADDVLIRVSKGEYVVNAAATAAHRDTLDAINYGGMPKFANGGIIGSKIKQPTQDHITGGVHKAIEAGVSKALAAFPMGYGGTVIFNGNITVDGVTAPLPVGQRGEFIKAVASQMGTSYQWGGASPPLFDCSGLMSWGLAQAGRNVGRLTAEGFNSGFPHISPEKPGDLVTFDTGRLSAGQAGHIGMVFDPSRKIMLHTDGAGPARAGDYASRGGLLGYVDPIGGGVGYAPPGNTGGDPPAGGWLGQILQRIRQGGAAAAAPVNYSPTGGVEQWRAVVLAALAFMGESPSLADVVLNQIRTESGGNPNAINNWDSNAMRGTPSQGLVQVIPPTFRAYALAPYNQNILDPMSNIIAGANYARHRYGSIAAGMRGVAYDTGGIWPDGTAGWNTSGGPEMVLKPWQWAAAQSAIQYVTNHANSGTSIQGGNHGGVHIHGDLVNNTGSDITRQLAWAAAG